MASKKNNYLSKLPLAEAKRVLVYIFVSKYIYNYSITLSGVQL